MDAINMGNKRCGYCGEGIPADSRRCPYCGSLLNLYSDYGGRTSAIEMEPENPGNDGTNTGVTAAENKGDFCTQCVVKNSIASSMDNYHMPHGFQTGSGGNTSLSNGIKVFLTIICTMIPGLGHLAGIIISIVFMNAEDDPDRRSFGLALLVASLIFFVISCLFFFIILLALSFNQAY